MGSLSADSPRGENRITFGAIVVLAYIHEHDATSREVARGTMLAESSVFQWVTELHEVGLLDAEATQRDKGRAVMVYHLDDDELGAAARLLVDRLGPSNALTDDGDGN